MKELSSPGSVHLYGTKSSKDISLAPPEPYLVEPNDILVYRSFGFIDICSFSAFTAEAGPPAAFETLRHFRSLVRVVASMRGVRIASWLGDGAMLVGVDAGAVAATLVELIARSDRELRAGVTQGYALLFEGDDLIGAPVNLASRLCEVAYPGKVLAPGGVLDSLPDWILRKNIGKIELRGLGDEEVYELFLSDDMTSVLRPVLPS